MALFGVRTMLEKIDKCRLEPEFDVVTQNELYLGYCYFAFFWFRIFGGVNTVLRWSSILIKFSLFAESNRALLTVDSICNDETARILFDVQECRRTQASHTFFMTANGKFHSINVNAINV